MCILADPPNMAPTITLVQPLDRVSFSVYWISPDPSYMYQISWVNLNTNQRIDTIVSQRESTYTVTGLSGEDNYNVSVAAVNECGMMLSDAVTVYGELIILHEHVL